MGKSKVKMVRSGIEPAWYWLDRIENKEGRLTLVLRLRWNVHQVTVSDTGDGSHTEYEYDEQVIEHTPIDVLTKDEVKSYIEAHEEELLKTANDEQAERSISTEDINEIREQLIIPEWKQKLFSEQELYAGVVSEIDATRPDKRYVKIKHLKHDIYAWCFVTGSVLRDHMEGKLYVGDKVLVGFVGTENYPVVVDRVVA